MQDQSASRPFQPARVEASDRAVRDFVGAVYGQNLVFRQSFDYVPHTQDDDGVCYNEDALAMILAAQHLEGASQSENHVTPALPAGGAVVELAQGGTKPRLFREALEDAVSGESVEDTELLLPKSLIDDPPGVSAGIGKVGKLLDDVGGLERPDVW